MNFTKTYIQQLQCLSPREIRVLEEIANQEKPVSIAEIMRKLKLSIQESINLVQSLKKRFLLNGELENSLTVFTVNTIWKQYLKNQREQL